VQYNDCGRSRRISTRIRHNGRSTPPPMAKAILAKYELSSAGIAHGLKGVAAMVPIDDAANRYLEYLRLRLEGKKVSERSYANALHRVPILAGRLKASHIRFIQDGHKMNCMKFMLTLRKDYSASTCVHFAHLLSAIWNLYIKAEHDSVDMRNWWHHRDVLPTIEKVERAVIGNEDWAIIESELAKAEPAVRFVCTVGHFTGARLMACADILVNDFDHQQHTLILPESKRTRVTVGCCDQLANFLLDWPTRESRFIDSIASNMLSARVSDFFSRLRRAYPGRFVGISHHSFRRSFITRAYALGIPKAHSMELVGHKQAQTHDLYKQKVDGVLVVAAQQIADSWR
jgi:integrase